MSNGKLTIYRDTHRKAIAIMAILMLLVTVPIASSYWVQVTAYKMCG